MIYLISNCTNSKKITPLNNLILKNYCFKDINSSIENWNNNIKIPSINMTAAKELYKGHSWQEVLKGINILSQKYTTELLVSSAGYGLIESNERINSYQATFSKGNENSIHNFRSETMTPTITWWNKINKFDTSVLKKDSYIFINVSYEYLIAMQSTITELIETFGEKVFIIVLSQEKLPTIYDNYLLRFDTRFNTFEKGTITSIIPRFSRWLFKEIVEKDLELTNQKLQNHIDTFLSNFADYKIEKRIQCTNTQVIELISDHIINENIKSATQGLKKFRSLGYACEQKRYGQLFKQTMDGIKNG